MPIGTGIIYNVGDLILSQVSGSGTSFLETKIAAATSSIVYFDNTARINSASLNSITVGTASYVSGSRSIITNLTASNISASGTSSFGMVGIGTTSFAYSTANRGVVEIYGSTDGLLALRNSTGNLYIQKTTTDVYINNESNGFIVISNNGSERWRITSAGILQSNGAQTIQTSTGNLTLATNAANGHILLSPNGSGNVGIGNSTPRALLDLAKTNNVGQVLLIGETSTNIRTGFGLDSATAGMRIFCPNLNTQAIDIGGISTSDGTTWTRNHSFGIAGKNSWLNEIGGNVGIGTTSPGALLDVSYGDYQNAGTIRIGADIGVSISRTNNTRKYGAITGFPYNNASASIQVIGIDAQGPTITGLTIGGGGTGFASPTQIQFYTTSSILIPGAERMRIAGDGNVGIGTTSPADKLHVIGNIRINGGDILNWGGQAFIQTIGANDMFFRPNSTLRMILTAAGNLGLGNGFISPAYLLDVSGSSRHGYRTADTHQFTGSVSVSGSVTAASFTGSLSGSITSALTASYLTPANSYTITNLTASNISASLTGSFGRVGVGTNDTANGLLSLHGTYPQLNINNPSTGSGVVIQLRDNGRAAGAIGHFTSTNYLQFSTAGQTAQITLNDTGNVGIGTTGPVAKLQVSGSVTVGGYDAVYSGTNVSSLNITAVSYPVLAFYYGTNLAGILGAYSDHMALNTGAGGSKYISFEPGDSEKMRITAAGNVGIGTSSPVQKLEVQSGSVLIRGDGTALFGTYYASAGENTFFTLHSGSGNTFHIGNDVSGTNYNTMVFTAATNSAGGNVGIGTNPTNSKLHIYADHPSGYSILKIQTITSIASGGVPSLAFFDSDGTRNTLLYAASDGTYLANEVNKPIIFATNSTEKMRIVSDGNVGIGTNTPGAKLEISSSTAASLLNVKGSNGNGILFVSGSGLVGIGTASPGYTLEVNGTQRVVGNFYLFNTVVNPATNFANQRGVGFEASTGKLEVAASGSTALAIGRFGSTGQILDFRYASTQIGNFSLDTNDLTLATARHLILSPTGNVGIGTTSPAAKLHIYNGSSHFEATSNGNAAIVAGLYALQIGPLHDRDSTAERYYGGIAFNHLLNFGGGTTYNGAPQAWIGTRLQDTAGSERDYLVFATKPGTGTSGTGNDIPIERMCIDRDGLVGIGTTSPSYKLDVQRTSDGTIGYFRRIGATINPALGIYANESGNSVGLNTDYVGAVSPAIAFSIATSEKVRINNTGNVGIGTTTTPLKLNVSGSIYMAAGNGSAIDWSGDISSQFLKYDSGIDGMILNSWNNTTFYTNGTERVRINSSGNVGIGTTAPAAKLEISGSSNSALMNIKSAISGAILYVSGSGAVGIGTSNVGAYTLQVNGSFAATTKSFVIEHPTKAGKKLIYGSLESPYHGIRLTGRDTLKEGKCKIQLPDYIYKLILHDSVNIQLTGIKCNKTLYIDDINVPENYFTIAYDKAIFESYKDYDFFWDFTAIRADVPELQTEM